MMGLIFSTCPQSSYTHWALLFPELCSICNWSTVYKQPAYGMKAQSLLFLPPAPRPCLSPTQALSLVSLPPPPAPRPCLAPTQRLELMQKRADSSKLSPQDMLRRNQDLANQVRSRASHKSPHHCDGLCMHACMHASRPDG